MFLTTWGQQSSVKWGGIVSVKKLPTTENQNIFAKWPKQIQQNLEKCISWSKTND